MDREEKEKLNGKEYLQRNVIKDEGKSDRVIGLLDKVSILDAAGVFLIDLRDHLIDFKVRDARPHGSPDGVCIQVA